MPKTIIIAADNVRRSPGFFGLLLKLQSGHVRGNRAETNSHNNEREFSSGREHRDKRCQTIQNHLNPIAKEVH